MKRRSRLLVSLLLLGLLVGIELWFRMEKLITKSTDNYSQGTAKSEQNKINETNQPIEMSKTNETNRIKVNGNEYVYWWFEVTDTSTLNLFSNLPEPESTSQLIERQKCSQLINGGFYGKNNKHLGWVVIESSLVSNKIRSDLLNGFLAIDAAGKSEIGWSVELDKVRIGLQSGPMLVAGGSQLSLKIKNDEPRRRSVVIKNSDDALIFLIIHEVDSEHTGPYLADMPEVVMAMGEDLGVKVEAAMNLDGGSASAFWDGEKLIREANPIGSYFCVRV